MDLADQLIDSRPRLCVDRYRFPAAPRFDGFRVADVVLFARVSFEVLYAANLGPYTASTRLKNSRSNLAIRSCENRKITTVGWDTTSSYSVKP